MSHQPITKSEAIAKAVGMGYFYGEGVCRRCGFIWEAATELPVQTNLECPACHYHQGTFHLLVKPQKKP